jgi:hypothetical protein
MLRPISSRSLAIIGISLFVLCPTQSTYRRLPYNRCKTVSSKPHILCPISYVNSKTRLMGDRLKIKFRDGCRLSSCCWRNVFRSEEVVDFNVGCRVGNFGSSSIVQNASRVDSSRLTAVLTSCDMLTSCAVLQRVWWHEIMASLLY